MRADGINPLPVSGFVDDMTQPQFVSFDQFDLETGVLRLTFSEPIDAGAVEYSLITLQSLADPAMYEAPTLKPQNQLNPTLKSCILLRGQLFIKEINLCCVRGHNLLSFSRKLSVHSRYFIQSGHTNITACSSQMPFPATLVSLICMDMED